jgi:hypothetical protein
MKLAIKAAVTGAVMLAATAANAANVTPGDVILYVTNAAQTSFYIEDLGVTMDQVLSQSTIVAGAGVATKTSPGSFVLGSNLTGSQPNLSSFLSSNPGSSWTLLSSETPGPGNQTGNKTFFATFAPGDNQTALIANQAGETSASVGTISGTNAIQGFQTEINLLTYSNNVNTTEGWGGGGRGVAAAITFGFNVPNGATVGTAQNLFAFSTNGTAPTPGPIEFMSQNTITLGTDGSLSVSPISSVPLPAAVWLFTSGLLGLAGIGRRRQASAV